jgi:hypothetical protein
MSITVLRNKCFGEVLARYETITKTIIQFYCYKCRKIHEIMAVDDWLNGVTRVKMC